MTLATTELEENHSGMRRQKTPLVSKHTGRQHALRMHLWRLRDSALRLTGKVPGNSVRLFIYRRVFGMKIGRGVRIEGNCTIWGPRRISIGHGTVINRDVVLDGRFPLTIGSHVSVAVRSMLLTLEHDLCDANLRPIGAAVSVGDRVFMGACALVLPGVSIGYNAGVAAGAVVTKDVDACSIVAGVPARPVGHRPRNLDYEFCKQ